VALLKDGAQDALVAFEVPHAWAEPHGWVSPTGGPLNNHRVQ